MTPKELEIMAIEKIRRGEIYQRFEESRTSSPLSFDYAVRIMEAELDSLGYWVDEQLRYARPEFWKRLKSYFLRSNDDGF